MPQQVLFRNFELLEPSFGELRGGYELLIEGDTVKELSDKPVRAGEALTYDNCAVDRTKTIVKLRQALDQVDARFASPEAMAV